MIVFVIIVKLLLLLIPGYFGQAAYHQEALLQAFEQTSRMTCQYTFLSVQGGGGTQTISVDLPDRWIAGRSYQVNYKLSGTPMQGETFSLQALPQQILLDQVQLAGKPDALVTHRVIIPPSLVGSAQDVNVLLFATTNTSNVVQRSKLCITDVVNPNPGQKLKQNLTIDIVLCIVTLFIVLLIIIFVW